MTGRKPRLAYQFIEVVTVPGKPTTHEHILPLPVVQHLFRVSPTTTNGWRAKGLQTFHIEGLRDSYVRLSELCRFLREQSEDPKSRLPYSEFLSLLP